MDITALIKSGTPVQITVSAADLKKAFLEWAELYKAEEYITEKDACEIFHQDRRVFSDLRKSGILKNYGFGRSVRYRRSELEQLLTKRNAR